MLSIRIKHAHYKVNNRPALPRREKSCRKRLGFSPDINQENIHPILQHFSAASLAAIQDQREKSLCYKEKHRPPAPEPKKNIKRKLNLSPLSTQENANPAPKKPCVSSSAAALVAIANSQHEQKPTAIPMEDDKSLVLAKPQSPTIVTTEEPMLNSPVPPPAPSSRASQGSHHHEQHDVEDKKANHQAVCRFTFSSESISKAPPTNRLIEKHPQLFTSYTGYHSSDDEDSDLEGCARRRFFSSKSI